MKKFAIGILFLCCALISCNSNAPTADYRVVPLPQEITSNDGEFTQKITHPKYKKEKTYEALISGVPDHKDTDKLQKGVYIYGRKTSPAKAKILRADGKEAIVELTIHEGRNRQVRKMFDAIGYPVIKLRRVAIGNIILGNLPLGKWRHLNPNEVAYLMKDK